MEPISTKAALLQALISGEGYGLELIERVREASQGRMILGQGTVYPLLRAMERDGLLKSREGDPLPERGGRARRYYGLTAEGRRVALDQRETVAGFLRLEWAKT